MKLALVSISGQFRWGWGWLVDQGKGGDVSLKYRGGPWSGNPAAWQILLVASATVLWSLLMLWLCYGEIGGDYRSYLRQWQLVLDGDDPWSTNNTYGPLHNVLAFLMPWGPFAPKSIHSAPVFGA